MQDNVPNNNMLWNSVPLSKNKKIKSKSRTTTCKKILPDGVNEDSDYLFSSWAEWERGEEEKKMENEIRVTKQKRSLRDSKNKTDTKME